ncbi:aquaporin [Sphaerisporangium rubeum]|uniref:Glycerol uptake facilitator-like aquaporin n=1 Tax=Sphaerisporangium rubeum TaxID=321317 RepID=A0A7X0M7Q7_9ACTN|nr:glycerol uptake facilitator-like aquaporin [Sphaerisporangium rubeum]
MNGLSLPRRLTAEAAGTAALVTVVVGSGIQADRLTHDGGVALLANSLATVLGLGVLIALLGPVSGAHFNPVVTLAAWWQARRDGENPAPRDVAAYVAAQITGAVAGAALADAMFGLPLMRWSAHERFDGSLWLAETVATAGLVTLILGLTRTGRTHLAAPAVACYIGAAYWFTSSTSFANPAVTIGRAFTDTYAGIAPGSVLPFIAAQLLGGLIGAAFVATLFPRPPAAGPVASVPAASSAAEPSPSVPAASPVPVLTDPGSHRS